MLDKLNQKSASVTIPHVVGGMLGAGTAGALSAIVPQKSKRVFNGALVLGSALVLMASQGSSKSIKGTSFVLGGVAAQASINLAKDLLANKINTSDTASTADKVIAGALGLGCPGGSCGVGVGSPYKALRMPTTTFDTTFQVVDSQEPTEKSYR